MEETQWKEVQGKPAAEEEPNLNGMEINGTAEDRREETPEEAGNGKIEIQKDTAKYYSRLGMAYFLGTLVIYAVQYGVVLLMQYFAPGITANPNWRLVLNMLPLYLIGMPLMMLLIKRVPKEIELPQKRMTAGELFCSFCIAYALMYVSNILGVILTFLIGLVKGGSVQNVLENLALSTNQVLFFVFSVLCAPLYEELLFRKLLADRAGRDGRKIALVLCGLMFGAFHGNLNQFVYATGLGLFFGFLYIRTGKLRYTVILHMLVNFMGSIAGTVILKLAGFDTLTSELTEGNIAPGEVLGIYSRHALSLVIVGVYGAIVLAIVVTGVILFFVNLKKFELTPPTETKPFLTERKQENGSAGNQSGIPAERYTIQASHKQKEKLPWKQVFCNPGMLLFFIFWTVKIIWQLFA